MKKHLAYLLDDPSLCQVWVEFALTQGNPMHDDYTGRMESVEISLDEADKIAQAKCEGVVVEYQGKEYTKTWSDRSMPKLGQGKARLWCGEAYKAMTQRAAKESTLRDEQDHKTETVIAYFEKVLKRSPELARQQISSLALQTQKSTVDSLYPMAEQALAQRELAIQSSDAADASAIINGTLDVEIDPTIPIEETKAALEHAQTMHKTLA